MHDIAAWATLEVRRFSVLLPLLLASSACGERPAEGETRGVLVSVVPQAYLVDRITGGSPAARVMIPPGANEATYEPTVEDLRAVSGAFAYVAIGHPHFAWERAWLDRLVAASPGLRVVNGSRGCRLLPEDPHVWTSPACARVMAARVAAELAEVFPDRAAELATNLAALELEIRALDEELRARLEPHRGRAFLVFHPAWAYLASEYGLRQLAIQRGAVEPTPGELAALVERARAEGIRTVFVQPQFSSASAELVARELGGDVVTLDPLAAEWPDALRRAAAALDESFRR